MKKYLAFLDIDGVFTSARVHSAHNSDGSNMWVRFDPVAVDFMNYIHDTYNVEFVLMSTWKNHLKVDSDTTFHWIKSAFANSGFRGKFADVWKTDPENILWADPKNCDRGHEVKFYLKDHGTDVADFILFDDNAYRFNDILGKKRLVRTDPDNGLTYKNMLNAKSLMGSWERK